jgi:signal transduction histidine kinase
VDSSEPANEIVPAPLSSPRSLSVKLILLTILFVMLAEILIFVPSIANFRMRWLEDKVNTAAVAAVVLANSDSASLSRNMQDDVLMATGAKAIVLREQGVSRLLAVETMPPEVARNVMLKDTSALMAVRDVFDTIINGGDRTIRVAAPVGHSDKQVEIILSDKSLRDALFAYARNVFLLSLLISVFTAGLVFYAIRKMMIVPIRDMTKNMLQFSANPENPAGIMMVDKRDDEIGVAGRELATMQRELQRTLSGRKHLADLGLAVSKINHDMRNMLAPAQLLSDRLSGLDDPQVQKLAPRLLRALDRAVNFSESVLAYGKAKESEPILRHLAVRPLVDEVYDLLGLDELRMAGIETINLVPQDIEVDADPDQLFRVLSNLVRNSVQALTGSSANPDEPKRLLVTAGRIGTFAVIGVEDTGPGLPAKARENLFTAFRGSGRADGTGLGLAIAHELVTLHGGTIELRSDRAKGTHFEIRLPDRPVSISEWKRKNPTLKVN